MRKIVLFFFLMLPIVSWAEGTPGENARVYFIAPKDGERIQGPVTVIMGLQGMGVAPAGVPVKNTGHHHLLVDTALPALDQPIPKDAQHLHFGGGQTEARITLPPGEHRLQLLLGDFAHTPHSRPIFSNVITITVE